MIRGRWVAAQTGRLRASARGVARPLEVVGAEAWRASVVVMRRVDGFAVARLKHEGASAQVDVDDGSAVDVDAAIVAARLGRRAESVQKRRGGDTTNPWPAPGAFPPIGRIAWPS